MKKIKIQSKNPEHRGITIWVHKNEIVMDRLGFVPVQNHPIYMDTVSIKSIKEGYILPANIKT